MSVSGKVELSNLIPTMWAPEIYQELRNNLLMGQVFNRDYEGLIKDMGDTVKVNQILAPTGEILTDDKDTFNPEALQTNQITVTADMRAVASFEITDLAKLQSMSFQQDASDALVYSVQKQIEQKIISYLIPSAAAPDHTIAPAAASDLAVVDVASLRKLLSKALVPNTGRYLFLDVEYYSDLLQKSGFTSSDFIPQGSPVSAGAFSSPLYGFTVIEHNILGADLGYAVHGSALTMVMQKELTLKISDLHAQKKFGYLLSADIVFGLKLMDNKRIASISG